MDSLADLLAVFGRMHPLLLHMPIGMLMGLGFMELVLWKRGAAPASRWFLLIAAVSAVVVAGSGWVLHGEDGYASSFGLRWHERLGIATAVGATLCCVVRFAGPAKYYRTVLLLTVGVMIPTGHFGSEITHGKGFLLEPFEQSEEEEYVPFTQPPSTEEAGPTLATFEQHIAPLLQARCTKCHGARKSKGDLRLDSIDAILAGGEDGAIITFASAEDGADPLVMVEESEIYRRLLLPLEHDDHMPPESKTQLTVPEIELLRIWLEANAPFEESFALEDGVALPEAPTIEDDQGEESEDETLVSAQDEARNLQDEVALQALRSIQVHVQVMEPGSDLLWIDFAAVAEITDDAMVERYLTPLSVRISDLSLSRTRVTAESMELLASMPNLTRLDLVQTAMTDAGLEALHGHLKLERLLISQTLVTEQSFAVLKSLPSLTHVWIWGTAMPPEQMASLRLAMPDVEVIAGDSFRAEPLEVEADLVFTSDAPLLDLPEVSVEETKTEAVEGSSSLSPSNNICPVSGKPVDPRYSVVHEGEVIGFCCPNCPKTFWEDPSAFPRK
ncbi:MAG: hypothetical protein O3A95_10410 [Planctomycetota bacterium]|nr:hypothetical protein [Planctomycetota bacterium]